MKRPLAALVRMHSYARPHDSDAWRAFCADWLDPLPGVQSDAAGNRIGLVPLPDGGRPRVAFSSHTDTVARDSGLARVALDVRTGRLTLADKRYGCLGADNTAGVFVTRYLYLRRIPGLYLWHAGEEVGCLGASHIASETPEILQGIDVTVAFDRAGTRDVITHQRGTRGASDAFARALAAALNAHGFAYAPSDRGVYTDNAEYFPLVAENVNLSVGYYSQHTPDEWLDVNHVLSLARAAAAIDWHSLPVARDPAESDAWHDFVGIRSYGSAWCESLADRAADLALDVSQRLAQEHNPNLAEAREYLMRAARLLEDVET